MSLLRDLVEPECAEPNALGGFVQQFTSKNTGLYHDQWERDGRERFYQQHGEEFDESQFDEYFNAGGDHLHHDDLDAMLNRNMMRDHPQHMMYHGDEELFMHGIGEHQSSIPKEKHSELQHFFKDFISSSQSHHLLPSINLGDLGLSKLEKNIIKSRSEVLFRQLNEVKDPGYESDQLHRLIDALHIEEDNFDDLEEHWGSTVNNGMFNPPQQFGEEHQYKQEYPDYDEVEQDYDEAYENAIEEDVYDDEWDKITGEDDPFEDAWINGEDRSVDAAWDETARKSLTEITESITRINDPKLKRSNFMKLMNQLHSGDAQIVGNTLVHNNEQQQHTSEPHLEDIGDSWVNDYSGFTDTVSDERLRMYQFTINESRPEDTFEAGMDLFNQGLITDAIITLESEVMRNPENSEAWMYLGIAHAENDKDQQAISCLLKAIDLDPTNLKARMALSVSYTNDYQKERALETLEEWLVGNPAYSHINFSAIGKEEEELSTFQDTWKRHRHTSEWFLEAARQRPNEPDPEVQTALGLLYNMSYEYEKAVDCFKAALQNNSTDYQLWNKLGATLANSNRSQEALGAYFQALEQKPSYVRARSNLGISYLALNMYGEAAQTFLGALAIHPEAVHIWDNLKMVFRLMSRDDLVTKAERRDVNDFVNDFKFIEKMSFNPSTMSASWSPNVLPLNPPNTKFRCDYVDLKDYLVYSRKANDYFLYEINKIKSFNECQDVWDRLNTVSNLRLQLIDNCIGTTENEISQLTPQNKDELRQLRHKLNLLTMEKDVETVLQSSAKKTFHKICK
ncbi:tetratricopeptide-like helical domain-containing protein [Heterostelium album PN500]|uniref:Tetratricopeptide-like helical domain-containing protein n=1 Tax=Heterostelium pallidum (strain ATCC 26659 / Pp 5 / PN500) TaxID=670386 RepID=D3BNY1_HETP5|nr:tetratricopeptide-like helical domain-containing protein [Heterostelium album PN500]EFA76900.1 tetratricopeptide-like helical domain-containing protein [Heterostelium album PN500]|eukprot:XP_020429032.1 tetratricopeptide-like helical domain-containing protein [Heterostelium album PN500]